MAGMDKGTIEFFTNQIGQLRSAVFGAINTTREELGSKIDASAKERREQIEDLKKNGCFKGELQEKDIQHNTEEIAELKSRIAGFGMSGSDEDTNGRKKFALGIGKMKLNVAGFKAQDIVMFLMIILIGFMMWSQQRTAARLEGVERSTHGNHDRTARAATPPEVTL